ncbi:hypothetical protein RB195_015217 [Necator americanus]|uniref:G-protein coupled receptors family 1 profile domain-containing protein n=1 Tax=Necator americanus TaxID=51031 RepID=A0ABR1E5B6_NECAM
MRGTLFTSATVTECFTEKFWPHAMIIGRELPAYTMILTSYERFLAVLRPMKYRMFFHQKQKLLLLLLVPLMGSIQLKIDVSTWFVEFGQLLFCLTDGRCCENDVISEAK